MHSGAPSHAKQGTMYAEKGHCTYKYVKKRGHVPPVPPVLTSMTKVVHGQLLLLLLPMVLLLVFSLNAECVQTEMKWQSLLQTCSQIL